MRAMSQADCDRMRRLCEVHSQAAVAEIMRINKNTVSKTKLRGFKQGAGGPARRAMPHDFVLVRDTMTIHQLMRHYNAHIRCIHRWIEQSGGREYEHLSSSRKRRQRIMPEREVIEAAIAEHGITRAAAALGVHANTLQRWREHYGLTIHKKRTLELRKRPVLTGWADRYFADRKAA